MTYRCSATFLAVVLTAALWGCNFESRSAGAIDEVSQNDDGLAGNGGGGANDEVSRNDDGPAEVDAGGDPIGRDAGEGEDKDNRCSADTESDPALTQTSSLFGYDKGQVPQAGYSEYSEGCVWTVCGAGAAPGTGGVTGFHWVKGTLTTNLTEISATLLSVEDIGTDGAALLLLSVSSGRGGDFLYGWRVSGKGEATYGIIYAPAGRRRDELAARIDPAQWTGRTSITLPADFGIRRSEEGNYYDLYVRSLGGTERVFEQKWYTIMLPSSGETFGLGCTGGTDTLGCCRWGEVRIEEHVEDPPPQCIPQAVYVYGYRDCDPPVVDLYYWDGYQCARRQGCGCIGEDCDTAVPADAVDESGNGACRASTEECADRVTWCGGWLGNTCPDDYYCAFQAYLSCGHGDGSSICVKRPGPDDCDDTPLPVIGCNGIEYLNACHAARARTGVFEYADL